LLAWLLRVVTAKQGTQWRMWLSLFRLAVGEGERIVADGETITKGERRFAEGETFTEGETEVFMV
jgi:hypothetical protein